MQQCHNCHSTHLITTSNNDIKGVEHTYLQCGLCGTTDLPKGITLLQSRGQDLLKTLPKKADAHTKCWGCDENMLESYHNFKKKSKFTDLKLRTFIKNGGYRG